MHLNDVLQTNKLESRVKLTYVWIQQPDWGTPAKVSLKNKKAQGTNPQLISAESFYC